MPVAQDRSRKAGCEKSGSKLRALQSFAPSPQTGFPQHVTGRMRGTAFRSLCSGSAFAKRGERSELAAEVWCPKKTAGPKPGCFLHGTYLEVVLVLEGGGPCVTDKSTTTSR